MYHPSWISGKDFSSLADSFKNTPHLCMEMSWIDVDDSNPEITISETSEDRNYWLRGEGSFRNITAIYCLINLSHLKGSIDCLTLKGSYIDFSDVKDLRVKKLCLSYQEGIRGNVISIELIKGLKSLEYKLGYHTTVLPVLPLLKKLHIDRIVEDTPVLPNVKYLTLAWEVDTQQAKLIPKIFPKLRYLKCDIDIETFIIPKSVRAMEITSFGECLHRDGDGWKSDFMGVRMDFKIKPCPGRELLLTLKGKDASEMSRYDWEREKGNPVLYQRVLK